MMAADRFRLVEAGAAHADRLVFLLRAAFDEYRERLDPPSGVHAETRDTIQHRLETGHAVMALAGGAAVGCVFYERENAHVYVARLAVLQPYRRHGLGRALIEYVEVRARESHSSRVRLRVRLALPKLNAYYERMGYHVISYGMHAGCPEPTFVTMEKNVT